MKCCKCGKEMSFENTTGRGYDIGLCEECEWGKSADLPKADAYSLLSEVRAVLEDIVEGEYRLFHSDSMDQDTGLEEKTRLLYEKVKRAF